MTKLTYPGVVGVHIGVVVNVTHMWVLGFIHSPINTSEILLLLCADIGPSGL